VVTAVSHRRRALSSGMAIWGVRSTLNRPAPGDYQAQREVSASTKGRALFAVVGVVPATPPSAGLVKAQS